MPLFDSEPALAEGERKVKRGLTGVSSAVPRIHLPAVLSRLLQRYPYLPQSTSKTLLRPPPVALGGAKLLPGLNTLILRHRLGASTSSKHFRETLAWSGQRSYGRK